MLKMSDYLGAVEIHDSNEANWLLVYDVSRDNFGAQRTPEQVAKYADRYGTRPAGVTQFY